MKRRLLTICFFNVLAFSQQNRIAVLPFDAAGISSSEASILTNQLSSELYKLGGYTVLERSNMDLVLEEQGFQQDASLENNEPTENESVELFDQDTNEEEDFEIPAFLRKQKF